MLKEKLEEYRDLKAKQKYNDDLLANLSLEIVAEMRGTDKEKLALADGTGVFTLSKRKTWQYSPTVEAMETSLKNQKSQEQAKGDATYTEKDILVFTVPKEKPEGE